MGGLYLWVKAFHLIAVIAWMAGLLYLPRLFVYHCGAPPGSHRSEMLKVMERRLLRAIMTPALVATLVLGGALVWLGGIDAGAGWFHIKLGLVLALAVVHGAMAKWQRDFASDANRHREAFYRAVNEVPTVLMIGIVVLAVVKPF